MGQKKIYFAVAYVKHSGEKLKNVVFLPDVRKFICIQSNGMNPFERFKYFFRNKTFMIICQK